MENPLVIIKTRTTLSRHGKHKDPDYFRKYYLANREKKLAWRREYHLRTYQKKRKGCGTLCKHSNLKRCLTSYQRQALLRFHTYTVNSRSFVYVPGKKKHPRIRNWNKSYYYCKFSLDLYNLPRGCLKIYFDTYKEHWIIWADIDSKKWTKVARNYRCFYVSSPKGHIRVGFLVKNVFGKTGKFHYEGNILGDAKCTGEVMLPANSYYDKDGKHLGSYVLHCWGTFFANDNYVYESDRHVWCLLKRDFGIDYLTNGQWNRVKDLPLEERKAAIAKMVKVSDMKLEPHDPKKEAVIQRRKERWWTNSTVK